MPETLRDKFGKEICEAEWEILKPHFERKALFVVSRHLDLIDVAVDIAEDNVIRIKEAVEKNDIRHPSSSEISVWSADPKQIIGKILIVSPYVLLRSN